MEICKGGRGLMIEVKDISIKFEEKQVFDRYSMTFNDNDIYAIMGKSGCGKSTLIRMIAGLQKPDSGSIVYNQVHDITKPNKDIFMMHQKYANFPWKTCIDNVLFPVSLHRKIVKEDIMKALELLKTVGLLKDAEKHPYELSGGMQQRLALARVLFSEPKVIMMDEPLSALDPDTRTQMQDLIMLQHRNTKNTIIMVTHDPAEAKRMGDKIINL